MAPQPGDLIQIIKDTHGYPDNWIRGTDPIRFPNGSTGIILEINPSSTDEPRTFYKVVTPQGTVSIFEGFTELIK